MKICYATLCVHVCPCVRVCRMVFLTPASFLGKNTISHLACISEWKGSHSLSDTKLSSLCIRWGPAPRVFLMKHDISFENLFGFQGRVLALLIFVTRVPSSYIHQLAQYFCISVGAICLARILLKANEATWGPSAYRSISPTYYN